MTQLRCETLPTSTMVGSGVQALMVADVDDTLDTSPNVVVLY